MNIEKTKMLIVVGMLLAGLADAHQGRTDSDGCHHLDSVPHCHEVPSPYQSDEDRATEHELGKQYCERIKGKTEVRHSYDWDGVQDYVVADCETDDTVYEFGLDKRSSLDSIQQALFFSRVTGKHPAVVIFDTDGKDGEYEFQIFHACQYAWMKCVFIGSDEL